MWHDVSCTKVVLLVATYQSLHISVVGGSRKTNLLTCLRAAQGNSLYFSDIIRVNNALTAAPPVAA